MVGVGPVLSGSGTVLTIPEPWVWQRTGLNTWLVQGTVATNQTIICNYTTGSTAGTSILTYPSITNAWEYEQQVADFQPYQYQQQMQQMLQQQHDYQGEQFRQGLMGIARGGLSTATYPNWNANPNAPAPVSPGGVRPNDRAKELFLAVITPEQRAEYERTGEISVRSRSGRRYIVECRSGRHGNIREVGRDGQGLASMCVSPGGNIPHFDAILGQIMALQHDEAAFRDAANFTPLVYGYDRHRPVEIAA